MCKQQDDIQEMCLQYKTRWKSSAIPAQHKNSTEQLNVTTAQLSYNEIEQIYLI